MSSSNSRLVLDALQPDLRTHTARIANQVDCQLSPAGEGAESPEHIVACTCSHHSGVCTECGWIITIGPDATEYGHRRKYWGAGNCRHRDASVEPSGYDTGGEDCA